MLTAAKRVVVKLGTQLLTKPQGDGIGLDTRYLGRVASQVVALRESGVEVTLVTSGAVGAGCVEMGLSKRPTDVAELQAVAAVGQRRLMNILHDAFHRRGVKVAQVLLTRADFDDRLRFLNIRNCLAQLHEMDVVPVLNENDTVAVDEIRFGDNDLLAALTCNALRADVLLLLTAVDGLLDAQGQVVDRVDDIADRLAQVRAARSGKSTWGSGGIETKLEAARRVTEAGEVAIIANGRTREIIVRLMQGEKLGTVLMPAERKMDSRSRWIGMTARPAGTVTIDEGASRAVTERGKSLLPSGVSGITGRFERGDVVLVRDERGREIARGLTNYASEELRLLAGKRSNEFAKLLGRPGYDELVHRDNLVRTNGP